MILKKHRFENCELFIYLHQDFRATISIDFYNEKVCIQELL